MGCTLEVALPLVKIQTQSQTRMSDSTPVKNRLIPAGAQMMSAWLIKDGCNFVKFV